MFDFFMIFVLSIISLLAVQVMDVECARRRAPRRNYGFARRLRMPRISFRNMLGNAAR